MEETVEVENTNSNDVGERKVGKKLNLLQKKRPWLITTDIARNVGREELLAANFQGMILHFISLIFLTVYIFSYVSSSEYYLVAALKLAFGMQEDGQFFEVRTVHEFWDYTEGPMMTAFYDTQKSTNSKSHSLNVLGVNQIIGLPRIRQLKVLPNSCTIHGYFRRLFTACYGTFSNTVEDKKSFGLGTGTAWRHSDLSEHLNYWGVAGSYSSGGFYVDFTTNKDKTLELLHDLKDNLWITRGTRAIFIDFTLYNANLNYFAICKIVFEFPPAGGVIPSYRFLPVMLTSEYGQVWEWTLRVLLYIFGVYMAFCFLAEIREIVYFRFRYFQQFWNYMDNCVILLTLVFIFTTEYTRFIGQKHLKFIDQNVDEYKNFEALAEIYFFNKVIGAFLLFLVCLKTFKYLNFNRRMAQLNDTLRKSSKDIMGFLVMFFIAYFAYAELGNLVFGHQVESYKSFGVSTFTLLRAILGDFEYEQIHEANWLISPIFFLSYIILIFFILLNMFLAIINDTYADIKNEIALAPTEMQMTDYIKKRMTFILHKCSCKNIAQSETNLQSADSLIAKIRDILVKCNFSDKEIEMYFTRYGINPLKTLKKEDVERFFDKFAQEDEEQASGKSNFVKWEDFQRQETYITQIENRLLELGQRVNTLLQAIETAQKK